MDLQDVIDAWNSRSDAADHWDDLRCDEMVEFALLCIEREVRGALDDLYTAVYYPEMSGVSVPHAIGRVRQAISGGVPVKRSDTKATTTRFYTLRQFWSRRLCRRQT